MSTLYDEKSMQNKKTLISAKGKFHEKVWKICIDKIEDESSWMWLIQPS